MPTKMGSMAYVSAALLPAMATVSCYPVASGKSRDLGFALGGKPRVTGTSILGQVGVVCDIPPSRHYLTLTLERRTSEGRWDEQASVRETAIPGDEGDPLIVQVLAPCEPGLWRVGAYVIGLLHGKEFEFSDSSYERVVSKRECR
ncbi:hypothetical protein AB0K60_37405 [Thermopolyspora sp. NPDC052614]|uniref:hypothetical protein n=1 Tax=Thermopolyspora sp. NPDC052614 TaxID=3155682 RepID=UPI00343A2DAE